MTKVLSLVILLTGTVFFSYAQNLKVADITEIEPLRNTPYSIKAVNPDGNTLFLTKHGFAGIYAYDMNSGTITTLTEEPGAGYQFAVTGDGREIYFRSVVYDGPKKFFNMKKLELQNGREEILLDHIRELQPPVLLSNLRIGFVNKGELQISSPEMVQQLNEKSSNPAVYAAIENRKIELYRTGIKHTLAPLGEGIYIWPSISPAGDRLLFTIAGKGTYISDLEGQIIHDLGYANAPVWSKDGQWIAYMVDHDDGHQVTESEIWIVSSDNKTKIRVTDTPSIHEMYPVWGQQNNRLFFSTIDGHSYFADLTE